jgi:hypothetical protein
MKPLVAVAPQQMADPIVYVTSTNQHTTVLEPLREDPRMAATAVEAAAAAVVAALPPTAAAATVEAEAIQMSTPPARPMAAMMPAT